MIRNIIAKIIRWQANKYIVKSNAKIVAITGSVGKTSTTQAIGEILSRKFLVRKTLYNYNTDLGVPCSVFATSMPSNVKNPFGWFAIILKNQLKIYRKHHIDIFVLELGTDQIGEIEQFKWLQPDINVVTAIAPEHMEQFKSIESVAKEELTASHFSDCVLINKTMVDHKYLQYADTTEMYNYSRGDVLELVDVSRLHVIGRHSLDALAAAIKVAQIFGLKDREIVEGLILIKPQKGRMSKLSGLRGSVLIDDTYNSSPEAVIAALDYVYQTDATQRIVLLGNMNELGDTSNFEHTKIGSYCRADMIDLVVTLGPDANTYTAPAASKNGCRVLKTTSPDEAADVIIQNMKDKALILIKGSQNNVFAEEVVKRLLSNDDDRDQLVRQSSYWLKKKKQNFEGSI